MKKKAKEQSNTVEEPMAIYRTVKKIPTVADFNYRQFEKIAGIVPFSQKEWAHILHLSERTLQRYAKDSKHFEGIYVDRILHIKKLIDTGLAVFKTSEALYNWLKQDKLVLGHHLNFESLQSTQGIQDTIDEIGRIQHGIYI